MALERSEKAKFAKTKFFECENDIDIYIEDTGNGYEKIYKIIFSRLLEGKYKVNRVFPLGGRDSVIRKYKIHNDKKRPYIFIVDGDLYLPLGEEIQSSKGLFILPCYCIENILSDPEAFISVLDDEDSNKNIDDIVNSFDYETWKKTNEDCLFKLFIIYAIIFKINKNRQTVGYSVKKLLSDEYGNINKKKLNERLKNLNASLVDFISESELQNEIKEIESKIMLKIKEKIDIVSGGNFLFPMLRIRANTCVKNNVKNINFKIRLARFCNLEKLSECLKYIGNPKI